MNFQPNVDLNFSLNFFKSRFIHMLHLSPIGPSSMLFKHLQNSFNPKDLINEFSELFLVCIYINVSHVLRNIAWTFEVHKRNVSSQNHPQNTTLNDHYVYRFIYFGEFIFSFNTHFFVIEKVVIVYDLNELNDLNMSLNILKHVLGMMLFHWKGINKNNNICSNWFIF
jgi:hypothetical protein